MFQIEVFGLERNKSGCVTFVYFEDRVSMYVQLKFMYAVSLKVV